MPCNYCGSTHNTSYYTGDYECYVCRSCATSEAYEPSNWFDEMLDSEVQVVLTPTLVGGIKPLEIGEKNAVSRPLGYSREQALFSLF